MQLTGNSLYRFDDFELDVTKRTFARQGQRVTLSPKAFEVLTFLVAHPGRVVTKEELMKAVWPESFVEESNLAQHISWLRKALGDKAELIVTIPGRGYQFAATVEAPELVPETKAEFPGFQPGEALVRRVRERAHFVMEETAPAEKRRIFASSWVAWMVTATVLLATAGYFGWQRFGPQPQLRKVVLGDFLNLTGDSSMDATLKSAVAISLGQTPYIQIMSDGMVHSTLSNMQKVPDTPLLGDAALEVCKRGNYQVLLRGRIEHSGFHYDVSLEPVNCATGKRLTVFRGQALSKDEILDALDDLSKRVRVKLGEPNVSLEQFDVPLVDATTSSFEALQDYNTGGNLGNEGKIKEAIDYFHKAVDIDPKFSMGWDQLGVAWWNHRLDGQGRRLFPKSV